MVFSSKAITGVPSFPSPYNMEGGDCASLQEAAAHACRLTRIYCSAAAVLADECSSYEVRTDKAPVQPVMCQIHVYLRSNECF